MTKNDTNEIIEDMDEVSKSKEVLDDVELEDEDDVEPEDDDEVEDEDEDEVED